MLSPLVLAIVICFVVGIAVIVALSLRAGGRRTDGTIAHVLYDAEHPDKRRSP